jgi:hypothetical protein
MVQSDPSQVKIQIGGNIDGNIVVGDNNFVVNTNHGTIVYKQVAAQVRPRNFVPQPPYADQMQAIVERFLRGEYTVFLPTLAQHVSVICVQSIHLLHFLNGESLCVAARIRNEGGYCWPGSWRGIWMEV